MQEIKRSGEGENEERRRDDRQERQKGGEKGLREKIQLRLKKNLRRQEKKEEESARIGERGAVFLSGDGDQKRAAGAETRRFSRGRHAKKNRPPAPTESAESA